MPLCQDIDPPSADRIVVTGLGAVSAFGWSSDSLWAGLIAGTTTIGEPRRLDLSGQRTKLASEVGDSCSPNHAGEVEMGDLSRADLFAVAAAEEAVSDASGAVARIQNCPEGAGVFFGGSTAGMAEAERYLQEKWGHREKRSSIRGFSSHQLNGPGDAVARALGVAGPVETISSACASGALAIGAALEAVRRGEVDIAIAGGSDSLCLLTYSGFNSLRAVDAAPCRPFRLDRAGLSLGEGAGVLVLERYDRQRHGPLGALIEVVGSGASCDAYHMTAPEPGGRGAARAILAALQDAGYEPDDVDFVHAHGTGTPLNDSSEWAALERCFGTRAGSLPVTSAKGAVGHLLGAAGAIEAVATVLCLVHREIHPTAGSEAVDPRLPVDLVLERRSLQHSSCAVSTSFAFGGSNAALIFALAT